MGTLVAWAEKLGLRGVVSCPLCEVQCQWVSCWLGGFYSNNSKTFALETIGRHIARRHGAYPLGGRYVCAICNNGFSYCSDFYPHLARHSEAEWALWSLGKH